MHDNKSPFFSMSILCIVTVKLPCLSFLLHSGLATIEQTSCGTQCPSYSSRPNSGTPELQNTAPKIQQQYNAQGQHISV